MGNAQEQSNLQTLLIERGKEYGQAWLIAGHVMQVLLKAKPTHSVFESPYIHNYVLIISKLCRILTSPNHADSWRDIAGYATLVADHLTKGE